MPCRACFALTWVIGPWPAAAADAVVGAARGLEGVGLDRGLCRADFWRRKMAYGQRMREDSEVVRQAE